MAWGRCPTCGCLGWGNLCKEAPQPYTKDVWCGQVLIRFLPRTADAIEAAFLLDGWSGARALYAAMVEQGELGE
jgi:hypothetical protein